MDEKSVREEFVTGLSKIRQEIKSRLVTHGLYGTVTDADTEASEQAPAGTSIQLSVKGRTAARTFARIQIEECRLRVGGAVLLGIIAMVEEVSR